jgi:hypothetical protein
MTLKTGKLIKQLHLFLLGLCISIALTVVLWFIPFQLPGWLVGFIYFDFGASYVSVLNKYDLKIYPRYIVCRSGDNNPSLPSSFEHPLTIANREQYYYGIDQWDLLGYCDDVPVFSFNAATGLVATLQSTDAYSYYLNRVI